MAGATQRAGQVRQGDLRLESRHEPVCYPVRRTIYRGAGITTFKTPRPRKYGQATTLAGDYANASLYPLIETARSNGIEPYRYLVWRFARLPRAATTNDYATLLPRYMLARNRRQFAISPMLTLRGVVN